MSARRGQTRRLASAPRSATWRNPYETNWREAGHAPAFRAASDREAGCVDVTDGSVKSLRIAPERYFATENPPELSVRWIVDEPAVEYAVVCEPSGTLRRLATGLTAQAAQAEVDADNAPNAIDHQDCTGHLLTSRTASTAAAAPRPAGPREGSELLSAP